MSGLGSCGSVKKLNEMVYNEIILCELQEAMMWKNSLCHGNSECLPVPVSLVQKLKWFIWH